MVVSHQGLLQPPPGHFFSNSSGLRGTAPLILCRSHRVGKPSYMCPRATKESINWFQGESFAGDSLKVSASPTRISPSRARESRTLSRSLDAMNPISRRELLRVREEITMSLSSPWKLSRTAVSTHSVSDGIHCALFTYSRHSDMWPPCGHQCRRC